MIVNHFFSVCLTLNRTWAARRKHTKLRKQRQAYPALSFEGESSGFNGDGSVKAAIEENSPEDGESRVLTSELGRPTLPKGTKLITFPIGHSVSSHLDSNVKTDGQNSVSGPMG